MKLNKEKEHTMPSVFGPRSVAFTTLRKGDWLRNYGEVIGNDFDFLVLFNSTASKRIDVRWPSGKIDAVTYDGLAAGGYGNILYLGRGEKRKWFPRLPYFLRRCLCEYSKP